MRHIVMPAVVAVLWSIPLLVLGFVLLVPVVGMGHGWTGPVPVLYAGLMLFPLTIARIRLDPLGQPWWHSVAVSAVIIGSAVAISVIVFAANVIGPGAMPLDGFNLLGPFVLMGWVVVSLGVHFLLRDAVRGAVWGDVQLIGMALGTDWLLYQDAISGASFGFRGDVFEYIWLGYWCIWQVIAVAALFNHIRAARVAV